MVSAERMIARRLVADAFHREGSTSYAAVMFGSRDNDEAVLMAEAGVREGSRPRTADEALRRMEALVERMASFWETQTTQRNRDFKNEPLASMQASAFEEACAIQALRKPVDPRLQKVIDSLIANGVDHPVAPLLARDVLKALDQ